MALKAEWMISNFPLEDDFPLAQSCLNLKPKEKMEISSFYFYFVGFI